MNPSDSSEVISGVLARLAAGEVDAPHAADELYRLTPADLVIDGRPMTPTQWARLDALGPELRWEIAKRAGGSVLPNVAYGSAEYDAFMESPPRR